MAAANILYLFLSLSFTLPLTPGFLLVSVTFGSHNDLWLHRLIGHIYLCTAVY